MCLSCRDEAQLVFKWYFPLPFSLFPQTRLTYLKTMRRLVAELYVRDNCHPFKATVLVWIQLPMWIFMSVALRNFSTGAAHSEGSYYWTVIPPSKFSDTVLYSKEKAKNKLKNIHTFCNWNTLLSSPLHKYRISNIKCNQASCIENTNQFRKDVTSTTSWKS